MSNDRVAVAFFDFDGTLTTGDTLMPFLKFVVGKPRYYWNLLLVSPVLIAYLLNMVRNDVAKESVLKRYLAGYKIDELFSLGERFGKEVIPHMLRAEGMERLRWHQRQGHECVLVSASLDIWLRSWAAQQGFTASLTTQLSVINGRVSGDIKGSNCYGDEKVKKIMTYTPDIHERESYAYGDTDTDVPMLKAVKNGCRWNKNKRNFTCLERQQ
jgi:HAD superfamily hydrolase (TIGR01490 family)